MAGVQVRLATRTTSADYVNDRLWERATLLRCPWHAEGGCGFCRHGTYGRIEPAGTRVARWYCPRAGRTVSALPDCLGARRRGTLPVLEAMVAACERAPSRERAVRDLRNDIELPGALRYLARLADDVHAGLAAVRGLQPEVFEGVPPTLVAFAATLGVTEVLFALRACAARHLPQLPSPLGFNPPRRTAGTAGGARQHKVGHDPPQARIEPRAGHVLRSG